MPKHMLLFKSITEQIKHEHGKTAYKVYNIEVSFLFVCLFVFSISFWTYLGIESQFLKY